MRQTRGLALYRPKLLDTLDPGLVCTGFGMQQIDRAVVKRRLDGFAAVLVDRGQGWLETSVAGRHRLVAPVLFWLQPGVEHSYGPEEGTGWHEQWALFDGPLAEQFSETGLIGPRRPVVPLEDGVEIAGLFATLHSDFLDAHRLGTLATGATVLRLIARAARLQAQGAGTPRRGDLEEAVDAIRAGAFGPLDLADLARSFGFSPATFRRQVRAAYGMPPKALQMQWRCARAKELLAVTDLDIEAIAHEIGFDDPYYFSRVFALREKVSPSAFRRRNRRL